MALTKVTTDLIDADFTGIGVYSDAIAFSSDAVITPDFTASNYFTWDIDDNKTLNVPAINPGAGMWFIIVTNDGTGGYTLALDEGYNVVGNLSYTDTADRVNLITISSNGTRYDLWFQLLAE